MLRITALRSLLIVSVFALFSLTGCKDNLNSVNDEPENITLQTNSSSPPAFLDPDVDISPQVGVNYNGQFNFVNFEDLERTQTTWVRGFIDFFQFYPDVNKLDNDIRITNYLELKDHGYRTILNIKWNFRDRDLPEPDSRKMKDYKQYLRKFLAKVWEKTDIIVAGNEPFIETDPDERDERLVEFYKEVAHTINHFRNSQGIGLDQQAGGKYVPLYIGAFNNLYLPGWQTQAVEDLFAFAREEPWIAGVDLHIHHGGTLQLRRFLNFAANRIRENQSFLVTEYSLMKHFRRMINRKIPEDFAAEYDWDPDTRNYEYIDYALKNPVPRPEWVDFLSSSFWFENRTRYLRNSYREFKKFDSFYVATYAIRQSFPFNRDFTRNTAPWVLNGLYANRTVEPHPKDGRTQFNYAWINDFRRIQQGVFDN